MFCRLFQSYIRQDCEKVEIKFSYYNYNKTLAFYFTCPKIQLCSDLNSQMDNVCFTAQLHRFHGVGIPADGRANGNVGGRGIEQYDAQPRVDDGGG